LKRAFERAGLEYPERFRPCHDLRVTGITTDARNGVDPIAIMANAGHHPSRPRSARSSAPASSSPTRPRLARSPYFLLDFLLTR
jgi:hypothetical protein